MRRNERPFTIAILALGGQGGGVLTKWLVDLAQAAGYLAQSTYIAGVAQRTGATVYCVEMFPADGANAAGRMPVFASTPIPGDVDLVIAGEMAETGRAILRGYVTPKRSTVIASSHRVYSIAEKSALGDGIVDQSRVAEIATNLSRQFIAFDMQATADSENCAISAVLFGAIAGSGVLPFERGAFEATIRNSGRAIDANLRGFSAGFRRSTIDADVAETPLPASVALAEIVPAGPNGEKLAARVQSELPIAVAVIAMHGALRCLEYQDSEYAHSYLDRLIEICRIDKASGGAERDFALSVEVARQLALQMCYEDTIRVADLKTRRTRFEKIREHVAATPGQPVHVIEYFHPRIEELCDTMPAGLGAFILRSPGMKKLLSPFFRGGRNIKTTGIGGFILLSIVSGMRRFRRNSLRYAKQETHVENWLDRIRSTAKNDYELAVALAHSIEMVKGYGDTYDRGMRRYCEIFAASEVVDESIAADVVARLHTAALADEEGKVFAAALTELGIENELV